MPNVSLGVITKLLGWLGSYSLEIKEANASRLNRILFNTFSKKPH
jgi:hypothetical protein